LVSKLGPVSAWIGDHLSTLKHLDAESGTLVYSA